MCIIIILKTNQNNKLLTLKISVIVFDAAFHQNCQRAPQTCNVPKISSFFLLSIFILFHYHYNIHTITLIIIISSKQINEYLTYRSVAPCTTVTCVT